ncbi:hypothetical protein SteCoe_11161 [Stentor coeruleus]|uniref:Amino acid transporter transmembrane domain-containing protein n=1 Tax=Stentor coeruleus TaxID=5963 RepID=A0A1R2CDS7_9CILI|nr:hypothetical protein SteCoe_11161 [Stentor coeruleus]
MSDTKEPLMGGDESKSKSTTYEAIQALFFMVAFSTGLGILGSTDSLTKFGIDSLLADFLVMIFVTITYTINHHMIAYCCRESSEKYNFAEYLEDKFGKAAAMVYDILMTIHNFILLAYIQRYLGGYVFGSPTAAGQDPDKAYYFLALINIPLIFISLTSDFKKIKWFCIVLLLAWIYIFTGGLVETVATCTSDEYWSSIPVLSVAGFDSWLIKLVGLQLYFSSAFQSLPFIYKEVKRSTIMTTVINASALASLLVYFTVYVFYTFENITITVEDTTTNAGNSTSTATNSTVSAVSFVVENSIQCGKDQDYITLKAYGLALAGACAVIVNVIPARFALAQFLAGNDADTMKKASGSDKLLSVILIMGSIVLSLFMFNLKVWEVIICIGVVLTSILGIIVPPVALLFSKEYSHLLKIGKNHEEGHDGKEKKKREFIKTDDQKKKIFIFSYLVWIAFVAIVGIVAGFFIMIDGSKLDK